MDDEDELVPHNICKTGDLLLRARDDSGVAKALYRVSSTELIKHSGYYRRLFASSFSDSLEFRTKKEALHRNHGADHAKVPISELPVISLPFPMGCTRLNIVLTAIKLFLQAIHPQQHSDPNEEQEAWLLTHLSSDTDLFAHLIALSDELDAMPVTKHAAEEILKVQPMCTKKPRKGDRNSERYWRQLLYIAYHQKQADAFRWISGAMILYGFDHIDDREPSAPWMNLPNNIEEEIAVRREGIFNTIAAVPNSLLRPYMQIDKSKPSICKLGYGNSPNCDSFQLGESIRWLCRRKLASPHLAITFAIPDDDDQDIPEDSPKSTIKVLKQFPEYQIDENHSRCGIKSKLTQVLEALERMISRPQQVGLCLTCWHSADSNQMSWSLDRRPGSGPYRGNLMKDLAGLQRWKESPPPQQPKRQNANDVDTEELYATRREFVLRQLQLVNGNGAIQGLNVPPARLQVMNTIAASLRAAQAVQAVQVANTVSSTQLHSHLPLGAPQTNTNVPATGLVLSDSGSHIFDSVSEDGSQDRNNALAPCPLVIEHKVYAEVFAPEKWTEKEWLFGD